MAVPLAEVVAEAEAEASDVPEGEALGVAVWDGNTAADPPESPERLISYSRGATTVLPSNSVMYAVTMG